MIHSTTTRAGWTALLAAALFNRKAAALLATGSLLAAGLLPSQADSYTYTGPGNILAPATGNFSNGFTDTSTSTAGVTPLSSALTTLTFGGSGSTAYIATDDFSGALTLNVLTLNSTATVSETIAPLSTSLTNSLRFGGASNIIT